MDYTLTRLKRETEWISENNDSVDIKVLANTVLKMLEIIYPGDKIEMSKTELPVCSICGFSIYSDSGASVCKNQGNDIIAHSACICDNLEDN